MYLLAASEDHFLCVLIVLFNPLFKVWFLSAVNAQVFLVLTGAAKIQWELISELSRRFFFHPDINHCLQYLYFCKHFIELWRCELLTPELFPFVNANPNKDTANCKAPSYH